MLPPSKPLPTSPLSLPVFHSSSTLLFHIPFLPLPLSLPLPFPLLLYVHSLFSFSHQK